VGKCGLNRKLVNYPLIALWWLIPATVVMFACAASSIPFGAWVLATSKWPSWMKGPLKWPLGDNLSGRVVMLQGWSYVFVGAASLVLTALLVAFPMLLGETTLPLDCRDGLVAQRASLDLRSSALRAESAAVLPPSLICGTESRQMAKSPL
jgi:hypothetical protein